MDVVCFDSEPVLMTSRNDGPPVLGIDLGGTKILVGVVSGNHKILGRAKRTTPAKEGGPAIVAAMWRASTMRSKQPDCLAARSSARASGRPVRSTSRRARSSSART